MKRRSVFILLTTVVCLSAFAKTGMAAVTKDETGVFRDEQAHFEWYFQGSGKAGWLKRLVNGTDWFSAGKYCKGLNLKGKNDWAVPDLDFLRYVYEMKDDLPINLDEHYWSITEVDGRGEVCILDMKTGTPYRTLRTGSAHTMCVRYDCVGEFHRRYSMGLAVEWSKKGFSPCEALEWEVAKDEAVYVEIRSDADPNRSGNSFGPTDARNWKDAGFGPNEARAWNAAGFTAEKSAAWREYRFNPETAARWNQAFFNPADAANLRDKGVEVTIAREWHDSGWGEAGFTPQEIKDWHHRFIAENAALWKMYGFDPGTAGEWEYSEFQPEEAKAWKEAGFSARDAQEWSKTGFAAQEASAWVGSKLSAYTARQWKEAGFLAREVALWSPMGPSEARKWRDENFQPDEARRWQKAYGSPSLARGWKEAGFSIQDAMTWPGVSAKDFPAVRRQCPDGLKDLSSLLLTNPYDNKGGCYQVVCAPTQLLSRTTVACGGGSGPLFFADMGVTSVPMTPFSAIVRGAGAFQYTEVSGAARVIPNVKVLKMQ